jgi:c-di-GMP-binding flagellar brake protein YcgR
MGVIQKIITYGFIPDASNREVWVVVGFFALLIVIFVTVQIVMGRRTRKQDREHNLALLEEVITAKRLTAKEGNALLRWAEQYKLRNFVALAATHRVFEECVQKEMERIDGLPEHQKSIELETITALRKKLGFDKPIFGRVLQTSRDVPVAQGIKIERSVAGEKESLASKVVANDDKALTIERPKKVGKFVDYEQGESVTMRFFRENGGEYSFKTSVFTVLPDRIVVRHGDTLERSQQRSSVRTDAAVPVIVHAVPTPNYPDKDAPVLREENAFHGTMLDLSSGGTRIEIKGDLPMDTKFVNLQFSLLNRHFDNVTGEVLKITGTGLLKYVNVEFRKISDDEQTQIFNYVCQDQIWRKKGTK